jgi:hypothetical protein
MREDPDIDRLLQEKDLSVLETAPFRSSLSSYINHLLLTDFNGLVQLLYRVDVEENRLKALLREQASADAADIIADLLIERQKQKLVSRNNFKLPDTNADEML